MRIVGLLSWWDESPAWLAACVASMGRLCDHVVALDGRYALYEDYRVQSPVEQANAIMDSARHSGMGVTVHSAPRVWATEMEKRSHLFRLGSVEADTFKDWFFVLDADERVAHCDAGAVRERLSGMDEHVGAMTWTENADPHADDARSQLSQRMPMEYRYRSITPRLFRALEDMRVSERHYYYTGEDERGMRVALWGQQHTLEDGTVVVLGDDHDIAEPNLSPWVEFQDSDLMLENLCLQRERIRVDRRQAYYEARDASGIEAHNMKRWQEATDDQSQAAAV